MAVVGSAVLEIIPSIKGISRELSKQLTPISKSGEKAGKDLGEAVSDGANREMKSKLGRLNPLSGAGRSARREGQKAGDEFAGGVKSKTKLLDGKSLLAGAAGGAASQVGMVAGGIIAGSIGDALAQSDSTQKFAQGLEFAKAGSKEIGKLTAQTQKYADDTVYDLGEIRKTTSSFAASGVKGAQGFTEALGNLNAVAGGTSESFGSVAMASTQIMGAGKLTSENWAQIRDQIPGGAAVVQKALADAGAYTGNFSKAMERGEISAAEYQAAIEKVGNTDIAKKAATSTTTFEGAWGNLQATVTGAMSKITTAMQPLATGAMSKASEVISKASEATGVFFEQKVKPNLPAMRELASRVADGLGTGFRVFGGVLTGVVFPAVSTTFGFISRHEDTFSAIAVSIAAMTAAWKVYQTWLLIVGGASKVFTGIQGALNAVLRMNPIGLVITALIGLAAGLVYAYKHSETFRRIVNNTWASVGSGASKMWSGVKRVFKALGDFFTKTIPNGARFMSRGVSAAWNDTKNKVSSSYTSIRSKVLTPLGNFFTATIPNGARFMSRGISGAWDTTFRKSREVWNGIRTQIFDPMGRFMTNTIPAKARAMRDGFGRAFDSLKKKAADPINVVINKVWNDGLRVALGKIPGLDSFKGDNGKAAPIRLNTGGIMPGYTPGRDVHRFVSPTGGGLELSGGEAIMRPEWTRAVGTGFVNRMNAAARAGGVNGVRDALSQKFSTGGVYNPVPGRGNRHGSGYPWATWSGDFPVPMGTPIKAWKDGVVAMVKHLTTSYGKHTRINHTDGSSSLYAHQSAIHVSPGQQVKGGQVIGLVGSTGNSSGPHLHFETMRGAYSGGSGDSGGGGFAMPDLLGPFRATINKVKGLKTQLEGMGSWGKTVSGLPGYLGEKVLSFGKDKIKALASSVFDAAGDARAWVSGKIGGSGVQRWRGVATEAAKAAGLPLQHMDLLMHRMNVESGGNPNAQNNWDINARNGIPSQGLMQTIPSTFRAYAGPYVGKGIRDPFANIYAAIRYTLSRYGLSGIGRAWGGRKGYANGTLSAPGGWAMVGERGPELVRLPTGSQVKTAAQTAAMTATPGPQRVTGTLTLTDDSRAVIDGWIVDMIEDAEYARNRRTF